MQAEATVHEHDLRWKCCIGKVAHDREFFHVNACSPLAPRASGYKGISASMAQANRRLPSRHVAVDSEVFISSCHRTLSGLTTGSQHQAVATVLPSSARKSVFQLERAKGQDNVVQVITASVSLLLYSLCVHACPWLLAVLVLAKSRRAQVSSAYLTPVSTEHAIQRLYSFLMPWSINVVHGAPTHRAS